MKNKKILIIEDDLTLRNALTEFLEADNFTVVVASDGEEGLALIGEIKPDLVLLDIILPKKNGFEVLKEMKSDNEVSDIPVMLLTNLGSLDDIEKALALGATTYLVKGDYQIKEIVEKIKNILFLKK
ncbi:MAG: response regulator [Candidatus Moranbacteria bacterium]|jgi:DNA-binding response OmpR family regulator|nr:response regulator [Candidatus Moranbacteria bacterium]